MKVGLLFGSFNPIHIGHLIIANYMANHTDLDKVWLVVSPQNPLKKYGDLINTYDRLEMAKLATDNSKNIKVSDVELRLPQPSYTIDTLTHLKEKHPEHEFAIIMGSDNLGTLHKWKNYKLILRDRNFGDCQKKNGKAYKIDKGEKHPTRQRLSAHFQNSVIFLKIHG